MPFGGELFLKVKTGRQIALHDSQDFGIFHKVDLTRSSNCGIGIKGVGVDVKY